MRYIWALLLVGVAAYLLTGVTSVRPGERAVVRRFGRVVATPGPGLFIGLPWGMDRVDRVPVDLVRRVVVGFRPDEEESEGETPAGQLLTGDHNLVNVQVALHYTVEDEGAVAFVEQSDRADGLVTRAAETVLAAWVAGRAIDDVLIHGKPRIPEHVIRETQLRIDPYRLGIRILHADVAYLFPPEDVRNAFDEVTRAQTAIATREHEARQAAAQTLRNAETTRFQIEKQTESYVAERSRLARANVDRFLRRLDQYRSVGRNNPEFLAGIWWEEIGKLFAKLREGGRIDFLDNHLGRDGLDITVMPPGVKKK